MTRDFQPKICGIPQRLIVIAKELQAYDTRTHSRLI